MLAAHQLNWEKTDLLTGKKASKKEVCIAQLLCIKEQATLGMLQLNKHWHSLRTGEGAGTLTINMSGRGTVTSAKSDSS